MDFQTWIKKTFAHNLGFKKWFRKLATLAVVPIDQFEEAYEIVKSAKRRNRRSLK